MILTHMPVPHSISQVFGNNATAGVAGNWNGTETEKLVAQFGNYQPAGHLAVDFACPSGTPIVAAAPGTVAYAGPGQNMPMSITVKYGYIYGSPDSGNITVVDHGDGSATAYSHQSEVEVSAGQWVDGGQRIGLSGATGRITGAHLHFEYMTLPINYGSPYYSRSDPMKQFGSASIMPTGDTTPSEDDELNKEQNDALAQAWMNSKTALDRINRVIQVVESIEGVVKGNTGNVKKAADAILGATDESPYVKSEGNADVYAYNVATGTIRLVTKSEWDIARSLGFSPKVVPQSTIDNAPKEGTK